MNYWNQQEITTTETTETSEWKPDPLTRQIIGAAIDVHRALGPGLFYELQLRHIKVVAQQPLPVFYKDVMLDCGYRLDLVIEEQVIVEVKSVKNLAPIHEAQLLSYLRLSDYRRGLLINFNVKVLKDGVRRIVT